MKTNKFSFLSPFIILKIRRILKHQKPKAIILNGSNELKHFAIATSSQTNNLIYRRGFHSKVTTSLINKFLFSRISQLVANSYFIKQNTLENIAKYCKKEPIVIHNGIPKLQSKSSSPNYNSKIIVALGRLDSYKQFDMLISAMPAILKKIPNASLWIVGEGSERQHLENMIDKLKLKDKVILKGFRNDIPELLCQCSLFVHPAREEAFGVVFLEAMQQKLPCMAFRGHAADEIIINNETGVLIQNMSINELAAKIAEVLPLEITLKTMGDKGYQHFCNNFTIEQSVNKFKLLI